MITRLSRQVARNIPMRQMSYAQDASQTYLSSEPKRILISGAHS